MCHLHLWRGIAHYCCKELFKVSLRLNCGDRLILIELFVHETDRENPVDSFTDNRLCHGVLYVKELHAHHTDDDLQVVFDPVVDLTKEHILLIE